MKTDKSVERNSGPTRYLGQSPNRGNTLNLRPHLSNRVAMYHYLLFKVLVACGQAFGVLKN
jgi:hypothetical protein